MASISQLNFLQSLGWALLNSLWQMALLWVVFNLLLNFFPKLKPAFKTTFATLFVTAGFAWFLFTFLNSLVFNEATDFYNKWSGLINENSWTVFVNKILSGLTGIYFLVLIIPVWRFISNYKYVQTIRNKGLSKIKAEWRIFVNRKADYIGIRRKVEIWLSDLVQTPVTIGFLKPVILIPVAAINHLSTQQVEAIILHELSHIRRYDYLFNLVINFIKTILYFNPFVNLFVKTIDRERENSCDEMVLQYQYQAAEYATALLLLEKNHQQQMMIAAAGKDYDLLHRVEAILGIHKKANSSIRQLAVSFFTLFGIVLMNIIFTLNNSKEITGLVSLHRDVNPYYFYNSQQAKPGTSYFATTGIKKSQKQKNSLSPGLPAPNQSDLVLSQDPADYQYINYATPVIPDLPAEDELKLKETIGATKKILEEKEWKEIEKSYAEVFNSYEKAKLKGEYQKEVNKINWNKLETQLRLAYDHIDWNRVDGQVKTSLAEIKLDSIQTQVNIALENLTNLKTLLVKNKTNSIPDSDVSMDIIKANQDKAKSLLEKIKVARVKKIVRL